MAFGILWFFTYGVLAGISAIVKFAFTRPIAFVAILLVMWGVGSCSYRVNAGGIDITQAMHANIKTVERYTGTPTDCTHAGVETVCSYENWGEVHFVGDQVSSITFTKLNGEPFRDTPEFHRRVTGMLGLSDQEPVAVDIDMMVWRVNNVGTITVRSDSHMEVEGITIE